MFPNTSKPAHTERLRVVCTTNLISVVCQFPRERVAGRMRVYLWQRWGPNSLTATPHGCLELLQTFPFPIKNKATNLIDLRLDMSFLGSHELYIIHNILPYIFLQIDRTIHIYIYIIVIVNIDLLPWRRSECLVARIGHLTLCSAKGGKWNLGMKNLYGLVIEWGFHHD